MTLGYRIIGFVLGTLLMAASAAMAYFLYGYQLPKSQEILSNWKPAQAIVVSNQYVPNDGSPYSKVEYRYEINGQTYNSNVTALWPDDIVLSQQSGEVIDCYVNPTNPSEAILSPHYEVGKFWIAFLGFFFLSGLAAFCGAFYREKPKPAPIFFGTDKPSEHLLEVSNTRMTVEDMPIRLRQLYVSDNMMQYRMRKGFFLMFLAIGTVSIVAFIIFLDWMFSVILGVMIIIICLNIIKKSQQSYATFDLGTRVYYNDKRTPLTLENPQELKDFTLFKEIVALQLLSYTTQSKEDNPQICTIYELNIVKRDGSRILVTSHMQRKYIWNDAQTIANALRIPIMGAI